MLNGVVSQSATETPQPLPAQIVTVGAGQAVGVHSGPGGPVLDRLASPDEFGEPAVLGVVARRGAWAAVSDPNLGDHRLGWIRLPARGIKRKSTGWSVHVQRSAGTAVISYLGRTVRRIRVGVGAPDSPTPVGRFSITDKLPGARYNPVYGCCILALSAVQSQLPAGWSGGTRVAIHGTASGVPPTSPSAGCIHASPADLRFMMTRLPDGTPVTITR